MANEHHDEERWTNDGVYYEYSKAANPIGEGLTTKVPMADFPRHLHESGPTRIIPFDLSQAAQMPGPGHQPRAVLELHSHPSRASTSARRRTRPRSSTT